MAKLITQTRLNVTLYVYRLFVNTTIRTLEYMAMCYDPHI